MKKTGPIRVLITEDHPVTAQGLIFFLSQYEGLNISHIELATDGLQACSLLKAETFDLLLLDLNLPHQDGFDTLKWIKNNLSPAPLILIYSNYGHPRMVKRANQLGAQGFVQKSTGLEALLEAIQLLLQGEKVVKIRPVGVAVAEEKDEAVRDTYIAKFHLTKRELEVLALISRAMSNKEIAQELYISEHTVSVHRKNIMRKLGVRNTAGLIRAAYDFSLL
jgi:DNA-binding NarL/FixJ family response regulator